MTMPSFNALRTALYKTTEYLAHAVTDSQAHAPDWNDIEWRIATAVMAMQGISGVLSTRWRGPDFWERFIAAQRSHLLLRHEHIQTLLGELEAATCAAGIAIVPLKGCALYRFGVYRAGERPMGDIDLFVGTRDLDAAKRMLTTIGYEQTFENWRHATFEPRGTRKLVGYAEHIANPVKIELHTRVLERLPIREIDITAELFPHDMRPGLNDYASVSALLRHLLLHAAGNMRARAARHIQFHDIALLCERLTDADSNALLETSAQLWWAWPPLVLAARYYGSAIPASVVEACATNCTPLLRRAARAQRMSDVTWSNLNIQALPGIEWCQSPLDVLKFARLRVMPTHGECADIHHLVAHYEWAREIPWYGQSRARRALRWIFSRPPRVQTFYSVRAALKAE